MAGELDAELWTTLPSELMNLVLRRLPIYSLCKFRAVCKLWSTLPTLRAEDPYFFCFPDSRMEFGHEICCKIYSFTRNQWEDLDISFLAPLVAQHCLGQEFCGTIKLENVCSNGGLLCLNGSIINNPTSLIDRVEETFVVVCNPLTRTTKFLPSPGPFFTNDYLIHHDPSSGAYKVFAVAGIGPFYCDHYMYDSKLGSWKRNLTLKRSLHSCSIVFNGVYYCVSGGDGDAYEISAYNINEEKWVAAGVETELDPTIASVSFVVRKDCLFLLACPSRRIETLAYRIDDSKELKLLRLDGSEELKLPEKLSWCKAFAYGDFILFLNAVQTVFTVVDIADPEVVKTRLVPLFPSRLGPVFSIYSDCGRATFNLHAKV